MEQEILNEEQLNTLRQILVSTNDLYDDRGMLRSYDYYRINCYMYALGLIFDVSTDVSFVEYPGFTVDPWMKTGIWYKDILKAVKKDLENLQIQFRQFALDEYVKLRDDEYLIKVFTQDGYEDGDKEFHFMRYDPKRNLWYHRASGNIPRIVKADECGEVQLKYGCEPVILKQESKPIEDSAYKSVGYFAVKELKKTM